MGSIGCHRPKGMSDKAFLEDLYPSMLIHMTARKGGVIYVAASKRPELCSVDDDAAEVFALVMPYHSARGEFIVKEQDETMGPYDCEAPAKLLALLSPTENEYANAWRDRCRANLLRDAAANEKAAAVVAGTVIRTAEPLFFGKRYPRYSLFEYSGKGNGFTAIAADGRRELAVSLGADWKRREYTIENPGGSYAGTSG